LTKLNAYKLFLKTISVQLAPEQIETGLAAIRVNKAHLHLHQLLLLPLHFHTHVFNLRANDIIASTLHFLLFKSSALGQRAQNSQ
jgi:hypothetical protein